MIPAGPPSRSGRPLRPVVTILALALLAGAAPSVPAGPPRDGERRYALREAWRFADGDRDVLLRSIDAVLETPAGPPGPAGALLLLLDTRSSTLHVLSAGGEHLRTLDLSGEGPGKLGHAVDLVAMPDGTIGLLGASPARIVCIDAQGIWRGDVDLGRTASDLFLARHAAGAGGRLFVAGQNTAAGRCFLAEFGCGSEAVLRQLLEAPLESDLSRPRLVDRDGYLLDEKPWDVDRDGRLCLVAERNGRGCYRLEIHEGGGSVIAVERPYQARRRSAREKALARWRVLGPPAYADRFEGELTIDDREPDVREVVVREVGPAAVRAAQAAGPPASREIWVRTSRSEDGLPRGGLCRYDVFAPDGEWLREAILMAPPGSPPPACGRPAIHFLSGERVLLVRGQFEAEFPGFCAQESPVEILCCRIEPWR